LLVPGSPWTTLFIICGAVNASGAIGDMWMAQIALRYPSTARMMDERDGMRVFVLNRPLPEGIGSNAAIDQQSKRQSAKESQMGVGIAVGIAFGLAIGVALHNIPVGIALGAGVGAAIGTSLDQKRKDSDIADRD
jgi:zinc transporter ZupT